MNSLPNNNGNVAASSIHGQDKHRPVQSTTPKVRKNESPGKIFDPKPPSFTNASSSNKNGENGNDTRQNNSG